MLRNILTQLINQNGWPGLSNVLKKQGMDWVSFDRRGKERKLKIPAEGKRLH